MTAVQPHRPTSTIGTIGPQQTWVWPDDTQDAPWIAYRASLARVACDRPFALTCAGCGCELDAGDPPHSPRCSA